MKLINTVILLFFASVLTFAQNISHEYFTRKWEKTTQRQAYFIRTIEPLDNDLYFVCDSAKNGNRIKKGYYKSLNPEIEHGYFTFIFKDLREIYTGNYSDGEMTGIWIISDLNGNITNSIYYDFEKTTIELDEDREKWDILEEFPMFRGGESEFLKYLGDNIKHPARALFYDINDRVICTFMIDTTGRVANIKIVNEKVDKDLEKEALRVLYGSPIWIPGKHKGKKVQVYFQVPITFSRSRSLF